MNPDEKAKLIEEAISAELGMPDGAWVEVDINDKAIPRPSEPPNEPPPMVAAL